MTVIDVATGRVLTRFGRRGAGPGELRDVVRIETLGTEIVLIERGNSRLVAFDRQGRLVREVQAPVAGVGASCSLNAESLAVASLGADDITFVSYSGEPRGKIHRLVPDDGVVEPLLRMPLLARSYRRGACIAVRPYGGQLVEFTRDSILTVKTLYLDRRPVRVERRGSRKQGNAISLVKGSPTVEDVCTTGDILAALRSTSSTSKVLDIFQHASWRFLGSLPIDASTIMIACSGEDLVAKEYKDGLLGFASYKIRR